MNATVQTQGGAVLHERLRKLVSKLDSIEAHPVHKVAVARPATKMTCFDQDVFTWDDDGVDGPFNQHADT